MFSSKSIRWTVVLGLLILILAAPMPALAWSGCGSSYVVQWGDTLGSVAETCGTSVDALLQANPNVGSWLYAGQTLTIPGYYQDGGYAYGYQGGGNCYGYWSAGNCFSYQDGGNYGGNPCVSNCYGSQYNAYWSPTSATYVVQVGDTMRIIADRLNIPLGDLLAANPQIWNPGLIYAGQVICLPSYARSAYYGFDSRYRYFDYKNNSSNYYTVQHGETLKEIAKKFNTTQDALLDLNPSLFGKPGRISAGMVILIR